MAKKSVTPSHPIAPEFFSQNGKYLVAPETTETDLHNDIGCWLETIHGTVDMILDGMQEPGSQIAANPMMVARVLYGVLYHVEMVQGALVASYKMEARHG